MAKTSRYLKPKCKRSETIIIFELSRFGRINFKDVFCSFPSPLLFLMETYLYLELIIQVPTYKLLNFIYYRILTRMRNYYFQTKVPRHHEL